jgi:hypothetical protein
MYGDMINIFRMSPIAIGLLRRHQAHDQNLFYGDPQNTGDFSDIHGFAAVNAAYEELITANFVMRQGIVSIRGTPVSTFNLTESGRTAVPASHP